MPVSELLVVLATAAAIAWVNWYFLVAPRRAGIPAAGAAAGARQITVVVQGGYSPATIRTTAGERLRIVFDRRESASCSDEVVFPSLGIRRFLPPHAQTPLEIVPDKAGVYEFTCGMSMLRGRVIAE